MKKYTGYSGGANGSDITWELHGSHYGVKFIHFWHGKKTPYGNTELSDEQLEEGWKYVLVANKTLKRRPEQYKSLLSRNWFPVKYADAVYAIGKMNVAKTQVEGGTGWAVQMAIDEGDVPVYVFDQFLDGWFKWNGTNFQSCLTPSLTEHFAAIGTRDIQQNGIDAINSVYKNTNII